LRHSFDVTVISKIHTNILNILICHPKRKFFFNNFNDLFPPYPAAYLRLARRNGQNEAQSARFSLFVGEHGLVDLAGVGH